MNAIKSIKTNPWSWIPSLYLAEGLPYFAVNTLSVIMFHQLGVGMAQMAFLTGWLYLPWVIKPFWSPLLDLFSTKRKWIIIMQFAIAVTMGGVGLSINLPDFLVWGLIFFWMMAFFSATHDIAADGFYILALSPHSQASFVGIRSTFYRIASVIGQGGIVILAGWIEIKTGSIIQSWNIVFLYLGAFFIFLSLYHGIFLPVSPEDKPNKVSGINKIAKGFADSFITFFKKPYILSALGFMLLYRLPEALCLKIVQPFLISDREVGGLGLTTSELGFVNGTAGVIALLLGGIVGGLSIARFGLKKMLWPMAMTLTLPCFFYCLLAYFQPYSLLNITTAVFIEQFGYGFGFTAYMLYLLYFCRGENSTSHYAFCTAFMALGMMIPGMIAGWVFEVLEGSIFLTTENSSGYLNFFIFIMVSCLATFFACHFVKIQEDFGKKEKVQSQIEEIPETV